MKKINKILITGTLSSGKTTLIGNFPTGSTYVISEVARQLIDDPLSMKGIDVLQEKLFKEQLQREEHGYLIARRNEQNVILCDRGLVDIIAYSNVLGHKVPRDWMEIARNRYDLAFVLNKDDILYPALYDEGRELSIEHRNRIDAEIKYVISELKIPFVSVSGNIESRRSLVEGVIFNHLNKHEGATSRGIEFK